MSCAGCHRHTYRAGIFTTPTLSQLRADPLVAAMRGRSGGRIRLRVEYGDIGDFHADPANAHATFQCASQFNCLEFIAPHVVPEDGVTGYFGDRTQGPACAIACGPGTIYRNYFVRAADLHGGVQRSAPRRRTALLLARRWV